MNGCEGFELPVPLSNVGIETLGQAHGYFIQWEQENVVLLQAPTTDTNVPARDMMPAKSAPIPLPVKSTQVPPRSEPLPHQVQKEDEAHSKRVVIGTESPKKK